MIDGKTLINHSTHNEPVPFGVAISGDATFDGSCFKAETVKLGAFPSGSFILGRSVGLEFDTGNGTMTFIGTLSQDSSEISETYSVSGGTCEGEGSAVLDVSNAGYWDY